MPPRVGALSTSVSATNNHGGCPQPPSCTRSNPSGNCVGGGWLASCMAIFTTERSHPVVRAVEAAARELAQAAEVPLWSLSPAELAGLTVSLTRLGSTVTAVEASVLEQADRTDVAEA